MSQINRQWLLRKRPEGRIKQDDFEYSEGKLPEVALEPGQILLRNVVLLCAPTMRNWMDPPGNSLYPSIPLGAPVMAPSVARVLDSADPQYPAGSRVATMGSWQDYQVISTGALPIRVIDDGLSFVEAMGRFGLNSLTGYCGLLEVGRPQAGDTLVVSAAAGSTGSIAAQVGKIKDCRVIGIAGGAEKCRWLTATCKLDAAIDYKSEPVAKRLADLCPDGIDIFFDNVGGEILQAAIENMAPFGRIVLCGQISSYNDDKPPEGPRNMMRLIYGSITMQGFLSRNYADRFPEAIKDLRAWTESGQLVHREDLRTGFENLPQIYDALFDGSNAGTLLAQIDDSATETS
ncbi:MAG: NADP-dependent oxidoreductase [Proteobacteria bacterium]|nr:NADP-dependent oxidoreductase [Pseudomonadota bacterium]